VSGAQQCLILLAIHRMETPNVGEISRYCRVPSTTIFSQLIQLKRKRLVEKAPLLSTEFAWPRWKLATAGRALIQDVFNVSATSTPEP